MKQILLWALIAIITVLFIAVIVGFFLCIIMGMRAVLIWLAGL